MNVSISKENGVLYIQPEGRLDTVNSAYLKEQIESAVPEGCDLELDFTNVDYISSAGLRLLVALQKMVNASNNKMVIRNPNKVVKEIFTIAGFIKSFTIL